MRCLLIGCVAAALGAQDTVLWTGEERLVQGLTLNVPSALCPALLSIEGDAEAASGSVVRGDCRVAVDGADRGRLSWYEVAPGTLHAQVPLFSRAAHRLTLEPLDGGLIVRRVRVIPGGIAEISVSEAGTKQPLPAVVSVRAMDGHAPPCFGFLGGTPFLGSSVLVLLTPERVVLPADTPTTLLAYRHPFHRPCRQSVRVSRGSRVKVPFVLGESLLPDYARVIEAPWPKEAQDRLGPLGCMRLDRVLGLSRWSEPEVVDGELAQRVPDAFGLRLLESARPDLVLAHGGGRVGFLEAHRPLRTVVLGSTQYLHSNGPVIALERLVRDGRTGRATGILEVRPGPEVARGRLTLETAAGLLSQQEIEGDARVPLGLPLPRGTVVLARFQANRFEGEFSPTQTPLAFLRFTLP